MMDQGLITHNISCGHKPTYSYCDRYAMAPASPAIPTSPRTYSTAPASSIAPARVSSRISMRVAPAGLVSIIAIPVIMRPIAAAASLAISTMIIIPVYLPAPCKVVTTALRFQAWSTVCSANTKCCA